MDIVLKWLVEFMTIFDEVPNNLNPVTMEEQLLTYWRKKNIFLKYLEKMKNGKKFVFCEGPPTANSLPHVGHALTRAAKDIILRYKVMSGYSIEPIKAGWDCHGLPVELEIEKKLKLNSKTDIERFGIEKFNQACKDSVFHYKQKWEELSERIAFWIDYANPYITLENNYIESVWWSLKQIYDKGLLYKGAYVVPYCPRCGTPLSSHEVAQGFETVKDPSIYLKFRVKGSEKRYFLVWTTTPWTLISNLLLAVKEDTTYVWVEHEGIELCLAERRLDKILPTASIIERVRGEDLLGLEYEPLFRYVKPMGKVYYVTGAPFVTLDEGTGIVHIAPAFGVEDYDLCQRENVPLVNPVDENGKFKDEVTDYRGKFVKDADKEIIEDLKQRNILFREETIEHTYPFCWRCDSPLLYYAIDTWFIATSKLRERMIEHNASVNWKPEHLKNGRFGNFLIELKDWALSRNRYWGTPLPIWTCSNCNKVEVIGSIEELRKSAVSEIPANLDLHRPYVDDIRLQCPSCSGTMVREKYVIDCWYDAGCAPFAQHHYPFENKEYFESHDVIDFISEAIDQTRGWFYTLHAIATLVFDKPAYKNVLCLGLILDENNVKMSKSKGNVIAPEKIIEQYGADALRLYFYLQPLWNFVRFGPKVIGETSRKTLHILWNIYSFFVTNANIDNFNPSENSVFKTPHTALDRWALSRLNSTLKLMKEGLDNYEIHLTAKAYAEFVDEISTWFLRFSRRRFWEETLTEEKISGYNTLYRILTTLAIASAPLTPYISEHIYLNLVKRLNSDAPDSVHLTEYPLFNETEIDSKLENDMNFIMELCETSRNLKQVNNIKLRQPIDDFVIVAPEDKLAVIEQFRDILKTELNVKNLRTSNTVFQELSDTTKYASAKVKNLLLFLNKIIPENLIYEGLAREVVRRIQTMRKELKLDYLDKIETKYETDNEQIKKSLDMFCAYIMRETLSLKITPKKELKGKLWDIDGKKIRILIEKVSSG